MFAVVLLVSSSWCTSVLGKDVQPKVVVVMSCASDYWIQLHIVWKSQHKSLAGAGDVT
jgi:hypothetical protein